MLTFDPAALEPSAIHKLLIGSVVPRPIAWVSTADRAGQPNLAPFSFFTIASVDPPQLLFCPLHGPGGKKDTLLNIQATGEFVLHIVSEELVAAMNQTAAPYPAGTSEFAAAGIAATPSVRVGPPRVSAALVAFECRAVTVVPLAGSEVVIGQVVLAHVHESVYDHGRIQLAALRPVARLAGNFYARTTDIFELARPTTAEGGT